MIRSLFHSVFSRKEAPKDDFSEFFIRAKAKEKKRVIKEVIKEANGDQRKLVAEYEKKFAPAT